MGIIIKTKKDYFRRLPLFLFAVIAGGLSPFLVGISGALLTEAITGQDCHEGNCGWMVLPWACMITIPISAIVFIVLSIIVVIDSISLFKKEL
ncbi:hypothetical protein [Flammeovirga sp. EKP202]|uniref:hypothetical protein n=1 Tax=Flammeovirga sp. EKP202 TaxID=2770592 RepID=UPI00165F9F78|nr:hypothetical protein [Flammeovirga sp. EKP202]MBD0404527.1 hypothetical protein [Flammeovirga sp. EKP202]